MNRYKNSITFLSLLFLTVLFLLISVPLAMAIDSEAFGSNHQATQSGKTPQETTLLAEGPLAAPRNLRIGIQQANPPKTRPPELGLQQDPEPHPNYNGRVFKVTDQAALNLANREAKPGDIIEIANGTYSDWKIRIAVDGLPDKRIIVKPATPRGVIFTKDAELRIAGDYIWVEEFQFKNVVLQPLIVVSSEVRITRNYFENNGTAGEETLRILNNSNNIEVDNNEFTLSHRSPIIPFSPRPGDSNYLKTQGHNIHHNYFHNFPRMVDNGGEIFASISPLSIPEADRLLENYGNRFEYNYVDDFQNDAEVISVKNGGWIVSHNLITNCTGTLTLRNSNNSRVEGNILINSKGIRIAGSNHTVANNYIISSDAGILLHDGYYEGADIAYHTAKNNTIAHNFVLTSSAAIGIVINAAPLVFYEYANNNTIVNNLFWRSTTGVWRSKLFTDYNIDNIWRSNIIWNDTQNYSPAELEVGYTNINPGLIERNGYYQPASSSSAVVNAGASGYTAIDLFTNARDSLPDVGAIEYK